MVGHGYKGLSLISSTLLPEYSSRNAVLVEVRAAAVNPLDMALRVGYGAALMDVVGGPPPFALGHEFRCAIGRQAVGCLLVCSRVFFSASLCSGVVVDRGSDSMDFHLGDEVYGAVDPWARNGCLATHLWVHEIDIARKPVSLTHEEAASIPFCVMTVWRSVVEYALAKRPSRALIMGRGSVGATLTHLLRDLVGVPEVVNLGRADVPLANSGNANLSSFDLVVDATASHGNPFFVPHLVASGGRFVTFNGVLLSKITHQGFLEVCLY